MYWNCRIGSGAWAAAKINRNMRCIEIPPSCYRLNKTTWLIETWDVLKYGSERGICMLIQGLIETWDVLKWRICKNYVERWSRLIETWDVLKS